MRIIRSILLQGNQDTMIHPQWLRESRQPLAASTLPTATRVDSVRATHEVLVNVLILSVHMGVDSWLTPPPPQDQTRVCTVLHAIFWNL